MRFMVRASLACVPALSQMKVGDQPRRAIARASGAQSGPYPSSSSKVRWHFSPPPGVNWMWEKWL